MGLYNSSVVTEEGEKIELARGFTKEEWQAYRERKKKQEEYEIKKQYHKKCQDMYGHWVFFLYNMNVALDLGIEPATLTKLIYLSTFMSFKNKLLVNKKTSITKKNLQDVLKISRATYFRFVNETFNNGIIIEDDNGGLTLNKDIFIRGYMSEIQRYLNNNQIDKDVIKIYHDSVREIYEKSEVSDHNKISYLFQMIPFINIEFNVLCHNPLETNFDLIEPMIMEDYCSLIGYSPDNARRLKNSLKTIVIGDTYALNFVDNNDGLFCCVNPCVFYAGCGDNLDRIEIFGKFKNIKNKHKKKKK